LEQVLCWRWYDLDLSDGILFYVLSVQVTENLSKRGIQEQTNNKPSALDTFVVFLVCLDVTFESFEESFLKSLPFCTEIILHICKICFFHKVVLRTR